MTRTHDRIEFAARLFLFFAFAFLVLFGFAAHAQTAGLAPAAGPSPGLQLFEHVATMLIPYLWLGLVALLTKVAFPHLKTWLEARAQTNAIAAVALKFEHFAELTVADLDATMSPELSARCAGGKLTSEDLAALRDKALGRMKALAGTEGLAQLTDVLGIGADAVGHYLSGAVEKKVDQANNAAAAAGIPASKQTVDGVVVAKTTSPAPAAVPSPQSA